MELSISQKFALDFITSYARKNKNVAKATITHILQMTNIDHKKFEAAIINLKAKARVALHFHPDRLNISMRCVAEALLEQGKYKNQFETLISNGKLAPFPGGERDIWENRIFGGAFQRRGITNKQRPKYGALNLMIHPDGPSPRFGSCYFLLYPHVSHRCTYTYMDSHVDPIEKGTYEEFDMILAALLEETFTRDFAIGEKNLTVSKLINHMLINLNKPFPNPKNKKPNRNLNHYIEAQVHGSISLKEDVETLVADPSFKNTNIGKIFEEISRKYSIKLYWHSGFALLVEDVPKDFRGPSMPSLAKHIAQNNVLTTNLIGSAENELKHHVDSWKTRGTYVEILQELKYLWHVLVKYGKPIQNIER